jgi:SPP1 gp7 family putative phage head morphogenesis protein
MAINLLKRDPTRTTMLRKKFVGEMNKRFRALRGAVNKLVVTDDVFGLKLSTPFTTNIEAQAWRFRTDSQKLNSFNSWFKGQVDEGILTVTGPKATPWTSGYVESAYKKGVLRAYTDTRAEALAENLDFYEGTKAQFLQDAFGGPEAISKMALLNTRVFEELKGISAAMSQQMSRVLADGIAQGQNPVEIARTLNKTITGITRKRARVLARTEVIHAHAEGQLDSFERLGIEEVGVMVEWSTAGDDRVCPKCEAIEGEIMTVAEARGQIPLHPNCRCAWVPSLKEARVKRVKKLKTKAVIPRVKPPKKKPSIKTKVSTTYEKDFVKQHGMAMEEWAEKQGLSLEEYKTKINALLKKELQGTEVVVRVPHGVVEKIIKDGRIKSQFETGFSLGRMDKAARAKFEETAFGYKTNLAPKKRPIYGYVRKSIKGVEDSTLVRTSASQYGNTVIKLKKSAYNRVTITGDDSFDVMGKFKSMKPVSYTKPTQDMLNIHSPLSTVSRAYQVDVKIKKGYSSLWGKDITKYKASTKYSKGVLPENDIKHLLNPHRVGYTEAQIHGGFGLKDIDEIIFEIADDAPGISNELKAALERAGIKYRVVEYTSYFW